MSIYDSSNNEMLFTVGTSGHHNELEYIEVVLQMETEQAERERGETSVERAFSFVSRFIYLWVFSAILPDG